jgi:N-methylhydantoinase A
MFGHTAPEEPVEIVSYRLRGIGRVPPVSLPKYGSQGFSLSDALRETRKARFNGVTLECPVYQRDRLDVGVHFDGPAIVDQLDATTVIPPGQSARVDGFKNILIGMGRA